MFVNGMFEYEKEVDNELNKIDIKSINYKQNKNKDVDNNNKREWFFWTL